MFEIIFGYRRYDGVTEMLYDTGLPGCDTVINNNKQIFEESFLRLVTMNDISDFLVE